MLAELAIRLDWILIWVFTRFLWFCNWKWVCWWWCDKRLRFRNFGASHLFSNLGLLHFFAGSGCAQTPFDTFSDAVLLKKWLLVKNLWSPVTWSPAARKSNCIVSQISRRMEDPSLTLYKTSTFLQLSLGLDMLRFCSAGAAVSSDSHEVSLFRAELLPSSVDEERLRECPAQFRGPCPPKVVFNQVQIQIRI